MVPFRDVVFPRSHTGFDSCIPKHSLLSWMCARFYSLQNLMCLGTLPCSAHLLISRMPLERGTFR